MKPAPANFDSVRLHCVISDWVTALREFGVDAMMVPGPDPFGGQDDRRVLANWRAVNALLIFTFPMPWPR